MRTTNSTLLEIISNFERALKNQTSAKNLFADDRRFLKILNKKGRVLPRNARTVLNHLSSAHSAHVDSVTAKSEAEAQAAKEHYRIHITNARKAAKS